jgi:hypothetical protein
MSALVQIILNGMKDWDDWIEIIHTTALGADIWVYINPNKEKDTVPTLIQPPKPGLVDIKAGATTYSELSTDEREQYRQLQSDYNYERKEYD